MGTMFEDQLERMRQQNADLKVRVRSAAFREAGVDTSKGVGKAAAKVYDGPAEADAIRAFVAEEFGSPPDQQENEQ